METTSKLAPIGAYLFLHTILTALVGSMAVGLTMNKFQAFEFALAATAANLLSLIFTSWALLGFLWRPVGSLHDLLRTTKGVWGTVMLPAIAYVITTVFMLMITFQDQTPKGDQSLFGDSIHGLIVATWIFFVVSFLANIVLLVFCYTQKSTTNCQTNQEAPYNSGQNLPDWNQPSANPFDGNGITILAHSPYNLSAAGSSVFSEAYEFQTLTPDTVRSVSSRTRLVDTDHATNSAPPLQRSYEDIPRPIGSTVCKPRLTSSKQPIPMETIPGSESNSPEKPLGWPFNERQTDIQRHSSVRVPPDQTTSTSAREAEGSGAAKDVSRVTTPSKARVLDESHIHPLFRSDSPGPHPTPSPTTCVVASALGGKPVSPQDLQRICSASTLSSAASTPLSRFDSRREGPKKHTM